MDTIRTDVNCKRMCWYLYETASKKGIDPAELKRWLNERYAVKTMKDLSLSQYKELKKIVKAIQPAANADAI